MSVPGRIILFHHCELVGENNSEDKNRSTLKNRTFRLETGNNPLKLHFVLSGECHADDESPAAGMTQDGN